MPDVTTAPHRLVIKVGSSVLTDDAGRLVVPRLEQLAAQVAACAGTRRQPLVVSSGAIACGMATLGLSRRPKALAQLQACAAVGQSKLMELYTRAFAAHGVTVAQVLLTQEDLANRRRFRNAKQTLLTLLHRRIVPIVNENDTVSVEEITFGDNDRLAALVACAVEAQLLLILTDVDGLLQDGKPIERIDALNRLRPLDAGPGLGRGTLARTSTSLGTSPERSRGTRGRPERAERVEGRLAPSHGGRRQTTKGGIVSKLEAARIVGHDGIPMVLANGTKPSVVTDLLAGQPVGTLFVPPKNRLSERKWWLAFSLRRPNGEVIVDAGAVKALVERGKSLLPSGVVEVRGRFPAGAFVAIAGPDRTEVARGICAFSSSELLRVRGMSSAEAARTVGHAAAREVVHRDHMVLAREVH